MDFGQIASSQAKFTPLPADDLRNFDLANSVTESKLLYGCPVWNCPQWKGEVFPPTATSTQYLKHYAEVFNSIELNSTHYMTPNKDLVDKWRANVSEEFLFCPKWPQRISHSFFDAHRDSFADEFSESLKHFGKNLGLSFLQMSPYFEWSSRTELFQFLEKYASDSPVSLELRHPSWFDGPHYKQELFNFMKEHQISPVITDTLGRRDCVHTSLPTKKVIIRYLGNELNQSDSERLEDWAHRLRSWQELGLEEIYFFAHQPDNVLAPKTLQLFSKILNEVVSEDVMNINFYQAPQTSLF